ncbi:NADP-dependent oxidoreductase [Sphingobium sp. SCG-1]|uniref:NADP-dependent oxidoreductase n=1 Tax=Sphingobium sp. SCG-1 TaxID=2072936 RepID=UPI000CD6C247|nr:NADP-dependent oxidoreductase [Sphingobium sp. SCG-1]AUW58927.1 NADP-dependent oxidoreductase [Sphingobium sp. SCG-1]
MAEGNRYWRLDSYPDGQDFASAIHLYDGPLPEIDERELLVKNLWFSLDAGTRMWFTSRTDSYMPPLPLGSPIMGFVLGRVVQSRHPGFAEGAVVRAYGQWADYSRLAPDAGNLWQVAHIADMRQHFAILGPNGWTAYVGLNEYGRVRPGETVLVSAAAGATGLLAAQFALATGCRVIGIAGGETKCARLIKEFGLTASIDYKRGDVDGQLKQAAPDGIDCYFDCVGGTLLDIVLPHMAMNGRIAICGLISTYDQKERVGPKNFDLILMKRLTVAGFFSPDFYHRGEEINRLTGPWLENGRVKMAFDVTQGLENTLVAYAKMFTGGNFGKTMVKLTE